MEQSQENISGIIFDSCEQATIKDVLIEKGSAIIKAEEYGSDILVIDCDGEIIYIKASATGIIKDVFVSNGQMIKKGDLIAEIKVLDESSDELNEAIKRKVLRLMESINKRDENNISEEFGEDDYLSDIEFSRKYGNKTYENIPDFLLRDLVSRKCSFSIKTEDISDTVKQVETMIEACGYSCRVYTENRAAAMGLAATTGVGTLLGAAAAVGMAMHNLATFNPDFEIGKSLIDGKVNVTYKK